MVRTRSKEKEETSWNRHMRGLESLWYYGKERSRSIAFDTRSFFHLDDGDVEGNVVFVSVKTVIDLGFSLLGNQSKDDDDDAANGTKEKVSEWTDEDLIDETPTDWKMSEKSKTPEAEITVRLKNNTTRSLQIKVIIYPKAPDSWTAYVRRVLSLGGGKSFKPTRQCDMPLEWPLLVKPLDKRQNMIKSRFDLTPDEFFRRLIKHANDVNAESKKTTDRRNTDDGQWTLQLYDDSPTQGYKMMSIDPFQLYSTWIHEDDWHSYMTTLAETGTDPIRKFVSFKNTKACNTLDELMFKVGERDLKIQGGLTPKERVACGLNPKQEAYDKAALNAFNRRKIADTLKQKRLQGVDSQVKRYDFYNGQTKIEVVLEVAKMDAASGKRPSQLTQAAVMGGASASDIATDLEWEKKRLASGFFSSEWLHLSAFSWGGFMPSSARSGFSTSQNFENLIFGTSETNSLMTRYEMAWQDFYRKEQKIQDRIATAQGKKPCSLQGRLSIHCNDFSRYIRCDFYDTDNKYKFDDFTMPKNVVEEAEQAASELLGTLSPKLMCQALDQSNDKTTRRVQDARRPGEGASDGEMLALAHDFSFVVYSMKYTIQNDFKSVILDEEETEASFDFFPFQRSLYHQAEAVLDAVVWKAIKEKTDALVNAAIGEEDEEKATKPAWRKKAIKNGSDMKRLDLSIFDAKNRLKSLKSSQDAEGDGLLLPSQQREKDKTFNILRNSGLFKGRPHV